MENIYNEFIKEIEEIDKKLNQAEIEVETSKNSNQEKAEEIKKNKIISQFFNGKFTYYQTI